MALTEQEFANFLSENVGRTFHNESGRAYTYRVCKQPEGAAFPFSVVFSSDSWENERPISAKRIADFLDIFNENPNATTDAYRNRAGTGSKAFNGELLYFVMLTAIA
jgi:hypothetical protein